MNFVYKEITNRGTMIIFVLKIITNNTIYTVWKKTIIYS